MSDALDDVPQTSGVIDDDKSQLSLDKAELQRKWVLEIERYEKKAKKWDEEGRKIHKRYLMDQSDERAAITKFNIFWSNVQTLKPALYSKDPTPEVERRFKDKDPVGRVAAEVIERCCVNLIAQQQFGDAIRLAVLDRLLPGRGIVWPRYEAQFEEQTETTDIDGMQQDEVSNLAYECVNFDFVPWTDFGHNVARFWGEVYAIWRISYLDRQAVKRRFGIDIANQLSFDEKPDGLEKDEDGQSVLTKAKIYEIWDKRTKRVIWLSKGLQQVIEARSDVLDLDGFFPMPMPLQATTSSMSFIPTPDYIQYRDQAKSLDRLSQRVESLTRALKVVGVYDASAPALGQLLNDGIENKLVPVENWAAFAEKGGLENAITLLDTKQVADTLLQLYEARDKVKQDIYEITGMSDLVRGESDPEETAAAQEIKSNYVSVRLKDMQREVQQFARDAIKIAAEIVCNIFELKTIQELSGIRLLTQQEKTAIQQQQKAAQINPQAQIPPIDPESLKLMSEPTWEEVEQLLRDKPARNFRIDIETDSTILQDERAEQASRLEFAKTIGGLIQAAEPIISNVPALAPALTETIMLALRSFKVGRSTESAFQEAMDKIVEQSQQPNNKPSPEQIKAQADMQIQQAKTQADMQMAQAKLQSEEKLAMVKAQNDMHVEQAKQEAQARQVAQENAVELQRKEREAQIDAHLEMQKLQFEQWKAELEAKTKIAIAELTAKTTLQAAQLTAAQAESKSSED